MSSKGIQALCMGGLMVLVSVWPFHAVAEGGCPPGMYPIGGQGVQGCAPIPGASGASSQQLPAPPPRPTGRWHKTWGAMAIGRGGDTGVSKGKDSKREAETVALAQCATWGADDCKVMLAYENQCAAIATPKASNTGSSFAGGPTVQSASDAAMKSCTKEGGLQCEIVYSDCSEPRFESF
ncbi:MAG: DUF4189 domain-containing protein [Stenotrophomonas indicatrix]|uniref:DUF4189 domain-containing protein n=1 Tax=Stenotrophomonas indicatrix TaxID=2045451 RepID=UPI003D0CC2CE